MPTIEERALALVNEAVHTQQLRILQTYVDKAVLCEALFRAIEAHDATLAELAAKDAELNAFKREVSDAVEFDKANYEGLCFPRLSRFTLPKPVDPLVEAVRDCGYATLDAIEPEFAADLRAALAARGGKIVWENANAR